MGSSFGRASGCVLSKRAESNFDKPDIRMHETGTQAQNIAVYLQGFN